MRDWGLWLAWTAMVRFRVLKHESQNSQVRPYPGHILKETSIALRLAQPHLTLIDCFDLSINSRSDGNPVGQTQAFDCRNTGGVCWSPSSLGKSTFFASLSRVGRLSWMTSAGYARHILVC